MTEPPERTPAVAAAVVRFVLLRGRVFRTRRIAPDSRRRRADASTASASASAAADTRLETTR